MTYAPAARRTRTGPSLWWFLGPVVLVVLAAVVGVGALLSTVGELDHRYGEVRADGEPHAIALPTSHRAMLLVPTTGSPTDWRCRVTDDRGLSLPTTDKGGTVTIGSGEASRWHSSLTFDPADAGSGRAATVYVSCAYDGVAPGPAGSVLLTRAPETGAIVARVLTMILGPLVLGGAAFVWFVVLVILVVTRRTGAAT